jgi:hypothetical protein
VVRFLKRYRARRFDDGITNRFVPSHSKPQGLTCLGTRIATLGRRTPKVVGPRDGLHVLQTVLVETCLETDLIGRGSRRLGFAGDKERLAAASRLRMACAVVHGSECSGRALVRRVARREALSGRRVCRSDSPPLGRLGGLRVCVDCWDSQIGAVNFWDVVLNLRVVAVFAVE